ncbi:MAG: bifunctional adenosylcobinamide kinase/adenosylcobinamide-phosphate guanylyltransferase [Pseudomonadota bacterium]|nr:bifunctional adenosylcobinamide kinase/adenosylcobinamide-phosphate guanylyltransferase [Pseudomonadota bacterium]
MDSSGELLGSILILGTAASGKSVFAEGLIGDTEATYVATAEAGDEEMRARIEAHKVRRGGNWTTIEEPLDLAGVLDANGHAPMLIDCLTLWLSNLMHARYDAESETIALCRAINDANFPVVLVSNEVGGGIRPDNALARDYQDASGSMNQHVAEAADRVYLVTAGIAQQLK